MKKTAHEPKVTDNPLYHDTWMLLRKYRDVVWSLELSVQQVRRQFQIEYGSSIEEFWNRSMWPVSPLKGHRLRITPAASSAATRC